MHALHAIFQRSPEVALFLALASGYFIGRINFGSFQLGGVGGTLLAAVLISQAGVTIDNGVKALMLGVFIYAVGYSSGPQFFASLHRKTLREFALATFLALSALLTVIACARLFHLNKGLAAGLAAGALTQSAIVGTAGDAIARLGLSPTEVKYLQSEVAIAFAVTYVPGLLSAILVCVNIVPRFMREGLHNGAIKVEKAADGGMRLRPGRSASMPGLVGRAYRAGAAAGRTIAEIEVSQRDLITVERVRREDRLIDPAADVVLEKDDIVLIVGMRKWVVGAAALLGEEVANAEGISVEMESRQAVFARKGMNHVTISKARDSLGRQLSRGVFILDIARAERPLPLLWETELQHGDVITFYGTPENTKRAVEAAGYDLPRSDKTDFVYMGLGLVFGLLLGLVVIYVNGFALTLGAGGGCLLMGLVFGWMRGKYPMYGAMPSAASQMLKDFGLSAFVAAVGLNSGMQALLTIRQSGVTILLLGIFVALFPLLLTMLFGRYVLRYNNSALLAGALAGSRAANPAFGQVLEKSESGVPTVPFAVTYAIASVLLALLGPLLVELV
jgi:putative transport protein